MCFGSVGRTPCTNKDVLEMATATNTPPRQRLKRTITQNFLFKSEKHNDSVNNDHRAACWIRALRRHVALIFHCELARQSLQDVSLLASNQVDSHGEPWAYMLLCASDTRGTTTNLHPTCKPARAYQPPTLCFYMYGFMLMEIFQTPIQTSSAWK